MARLHRDEPKPWVVIQMNLKTTYDLVGRIALLVGNSMRILVVAVLWLVTLLHIVTRDFNIAHLMGTLAFLKASPASFAFE